MTHALRLLSPVVLRPHEDISPAPCPLLPPSHQRRCEDESPESSDQTSPSPFSASLPNCCLTSENSHKLLWAAVKYEHTSLARGVQLRVKTGWWSVRPPGTCWRSMCGETARKRRVWASEPASLSLEDTPTTTTHHPPDFEQLVSLFEPFQPGRQVVALPWILWRLKQYIYIYESTMQETGVRSLGREDPLDKGMTTYLSFLPGEFRGQRSLAVYSPWRRKGLDTTKQL